MLDELGIKYNTDKSSKNHDYLEYYERLFDGQNIKSILEIGVEHGGSVKMWAEFFPNAQVVGVDISHGCKIHETDRIKIEIGNATDVVFLQSLRKKYGSFDVIIDDGSHYAQDMFATLISMYDVANKYYIIEDMDTQGYNSVYVCYQQQGDFFQLAGTFLKGYMTIGSKIESIELVKHKLLAIKMKRR